MRALVRDVCEIRMAVASMGGPPDRGNVISTFWHFGCWSMAGSAMLAEASGDKHDVSSDRHAHGTFPFIST